MVVRCLDKYKTNINIKIISTLISTLYLLFFYYIFSLIFTFDLYYLLFFLIFDWGYNDFIIIVFIFDSLIHDFKLKIYVLALEIKLYYDNCKQLLLFNQYEYTYFLFHYG